MYKYLPRHTFGYIQSKLFPKYFMLGTVLSSIVLGTFIIDNPMNNWNFEQKLQVKELRNINCIVVPITGPANHTHIQCPPTPTYAHDVMLLTSLHWACCNSDTQVIEGLTR